MKVGVITFPGTLDEGDARRAVKLAGGEPVDLWHADENLQGVDAVIIPGGFSYGDYLRCGAIAALAPVMREVITQAKAGIPVLGICNGFQVLCESGLLPGALVRNDHQKFICREQRLRVESTRTAWTSGFSEGDEIVIPLKNGEGSYQAHDETIAELEGEGRVVFRYLEVNPNGSRNDIAGITNETGSVVGLMPHPEHAVEAGFGPDSQSGIRTGTDGLLIFQSLMGVLR
ncbi:phosphoribosylformylglycinamidine synthase subunit PurQ [Flaviflexus huanghaiensis]|uniref:phosphoribosylformylglycinamidine synthase subunit PurQ n=1 Tax=Flaviflexus huanghaiensis TaxID=1111473 RepID=UPI0015FD4CC1